MQIVRVLLRNSRATRAQIATETDIPESTVQRRVQQLERSGSLTYHLALTSDNPFFPTRSLISFNVDSAGLRSKRYGYRNQQEFVAFLTGGLTKVAKFAKVMTGVVLERAEVVLGGHSDLIIIISAVDSKTLADFLTLVLRKLPGVRDTNTATLVSYPSFVSGPHATNRAPQGRSEAGW